MDIHLNNISIENFKGIKSFGTEFNGNTIIKGENGSGKTTVYDAFLWLLFSKDSSGRKEFGLRPLDKDNNAIKGLVVAVEAHIMFGGMRHDLRKEHHEESNRKGYKTLCWIDEVPKKISEYTDWIKEVINEDTFKLLTDTHFFNDKYHWTDRRNILLDIAGEIGTPEGFEELIETLNGRSVEEYRKVLAERKKLANKERDEINPRIDELQKQLDDYAGGDTADQEKARKAIEDELAALTILRQEIVEGQNARQVKIDELNRLQGKRTIREGELKNDTTAVDAFIKERTQITDSVEKKKTEIMQKQSAIRHKQTYIDGIKGKAFAYSAQLSPIRQQANELKVIKESDKICGACGQALSIDKIEQLIKDNALLLKGVIAQGDGIYIKVQQCDTDFAAAAEELKDFQGHLSILEKELEDGIKWRDERKEIIEKSIAANVTVDPAVDETCIELSKQINTLASEIGEPAGNQLRQIEDNRREKNKELAAVERTLAASDQMKKNTERIAELEEKEKEFAQSIANIEKEIADIDQYKKAESGLITEAVNDKFAHVTFKLFDTLLNGSIEDCCEAILNGTPYPDMSCGEKNFVGIDIINVLSDHYDLSVPLFIDNAESMTLPIEAKSQVIELYAVPGVKELVVHEANVRAVA
ncbi:hypothetical protein LCGC14_0362300 [marine sediment metagenome]|uniref:Rad50/SbcC-type AAA domain-containing protein n=1 Tax=marine sediment metagenome TaxID=412755 RepID=A0A0F9TQL9_9ZZZZ